MPGETIKLTLTFTNITQEPLTLSNFPPYTELSHTYTLVKSFERGSQEIELAPGESTESSLIWDQLDTDGKQVRPAVYSVAAEYITVTQGTPSKNNTAELSCFNNSIYHISAGSHGEGY